MYDWLKTFTHKEECIPEAAEFSATKAGLLRREVGPLDCCEEARLLMLDAEVLKHASTAGSGKDTFILQRKSTP